MTGLPRPGAPRTGILTAGTWCLDINRLIEFWPQEDQIAEWTDEQREGGGSACNSALDLRVLDPGLLVDTIGLVGDDENGRALRGFAEQAGIGCAQMQVLPGASTHVSEAFVSANTRRRTHLHAPGVATLMTPDHFDFTGLNHKILHLGLPGCHRLMDATDDAGCNGWVTVLRKARAAGLMTNLEVITMPPEKLRRIVMPCLPYLDMLVVNDAEIGALAGIETITNGAPDLNACLDAAHSVLAQGTMALVVAHSPHGSAAVSRAGVAIKQASVQVPGDAIAGPNGAGDAFAAGMLYAVHENWPLRDALKLAHAAAAASLRQVSTTHGMATVQACLALADDWGWRADPA